VLNHGEYESFKKEVQSLATRKGYFQGRFTRNELAVAPDLHQAWWRLTFSSGPRWKFGEVHFSGSQIDDEILQNLIPFEKGDPYTSEGLANLNERLADTGWFNYAVVAPDFRNATPDKELPFEGRMDQALGEFEGTQSGALERRFRPRAGIRLQLQDAPARESA